MKRLVVCLGLWLLCVGQAWAQPSGAKGAADAKGASDAKATKESAASKDAQKDKSDSKASATDKKAPAQSPAPGTKEGQPDGPPTTDGQQADENCNDACRELVARVMLRSAQDFYQVEQVSMAIQYLKQIRARYPRTKAGQRALLLLKAWQKTQRTRFDLGGRIEFVVFSSLYGVALGGLLPLAFEASEAWIYGLSLLGFTAAALTGSLLWTQYRPISAGEASSVTTGTIWGAWNFLAIAGIFNVNDSDLLKLAELGSAVGYAAGLVSGILLKPKIGQVTMASSVGVWLTAYTGLALLLLIDNNVNPSQQAVFTALLAASDLGLVAGALLHRQTRFSRSRIFLINVGGVVGGAVGGGIMLIVSSLVTSMKATPALVVVGITATAGLGLTTWLTRKMKPEGPDAAVAGSGSLLHYRRGRWAWDVPTPMFMPGRTPQGTVDMRLQLPLLSGRW